MMILHDIKNNILIYDTYYSYGYQYEYENWYLHKEINIFEKRNRKTTTELAVHATNMIIKIWKKIIKL